MCLMLTFVTSLFLKVDSREQLSSVDSAQAAEEAASEPDAGRAGVDVERKLRQWPPRVGQRKWKVSFYICPSFMVTRVLRVSKKCRLQRNFPLKSGTSFYSSLLVEDRSTRSIASSFTSPIRKSPSDSATPELVSSQSSEEVPFSQKSYVSQEKFRRGRKLDFESPVLCSQPKDK